ncbi:ABC transporter substrate-binding protein [Pontibacterium granulatum]|uniref:ABC transporter substrate-binding protein n=1 Tax=Pontibacterium granulatum TaxID=2036029 RepID=UPI00249B3766|nr:ABC transporter substrate-binding protein [Pontibacterium granulatum]MDI3324229.1 ABC transporter substrate-binding protein [Pontibacterium granulatum]
MKWFLVLLIAIHSTIAFALPTKTAQGKQAVSLQLLWKNQFQFAGYYIAKEKGFYNEAGLEVDIREFSHQVDLVGDVLEGKSDFAVGRSSLLIEKANGKDIVALFAAYQQSPLMLLSKASSGIKKPMDLKGKRIMITHDAEQVAEVMAMLLQAGLRRTDYEHQHHSFNLQDMIEDKTDAMGSYISNEPFQMEQLGIPYTILHPADFGFDMYADILFTSRKLLDEQPDLTLQFYEASLKGWHYAFDHIEETAQLIYSHYNSQKRSLDALIYEGNALKKLAFDEKGYFGTLSPEKFESMAKLYLIIGALSPNYDFKGFIYKPEVVMFTERERAYLSHKGDITLCASRDWMPYQGIKENNYQGLVSDYMSLLLDKLDLTITVMPSDSWPQTLNMIRSGLCDIAPGAMATPKRGQHLAFSRPYLSMPAVVAVHNRSQFSDTAEQLADKRLAVRSDSAFYEILVNRYPNATIVPVASVSDGLRRLETGDVFGFIDAPASISYTMQAEHLMDITLYNSLNDQWDLSVAVRRDNQILLDIINRVIGTLSPQEHNAIANHWLNIRYAYKVDYSRVWLVGALFLLILMLVAYRYKVVAGYNRQLKFMAQHDALTGISNRNKLYEYLTNSLEIYRRYERPSAVIFFDVDDFKQVNDQHGHNEGDRILITLADVVKTAIRKTDQIGRWGGEEFLIILPESDLEMAATLAEKLRATIAQHDFGLGKHTITCSFGIAQVQQADTIASLIHRADNALYQAKNGGKNCVRAAESAAESA